MLYIEPGSPWETGYWESFNGKLRDECLNGQIFYALTEAQVEALKVLQGRMADVMKRWEEIKSAELPALNRRLHQANLPELRIRQRPLLQMDSDNEE